MKRLLTLLTLLCLGTMFGQTPSLPITNANNLKLVNPVEGANSDSIIVWRGTGDKVLRYLAKSDLNIAFPDLDLDHISQLYSYPGDEDVLTVADTAYFNQNGVFRRDYTERIVDSIMVYPANGGGYWVRQFKGSPDVSFYPPTKMPKDTLAPLYNSNIIQPDLKALVSARQSSGTHLSIGSVGSSISAGSVGYGTAAVYGETNGLINASGQTLFGTGIILQDLNFVAPDSTRYQVVKPYNANVKSVPSIVQSLPIPVHCLVANASPNFTYTLKQYYPQLRDSLTVYYLSRTNAASASFNVTTTLGTTTINTYTPPVTYLSTSYNKTLTLEKKTIPIPATKNVTITINGVTGSGTDFACIAGFAFGSGATLKNWGVSSSSLKNLSSYNVDERGITTDERMDSLFKYKPDIIMMQWVDSRDSLDVSPEEYGYDLTRRIEQCRREFPRSAIVLVSNPAAKVGDTVGRANIPIYNNIMRRVAIRNRVSFIDMEKIFDDLQNLYFDGIHPNPTGYRALGDLLLGAFGFKPLKVTDGFDRNFLLSTSNDFIKNGTTLQTANMNISGTGTFAGVLKSTANGALGAPSLGIGSATSGFYVPTTNQLGITINSIGVGYYGIVGTGGFLRFLQSGTGSTAAGRPVVSSTADTDTGLYFPAVGSVGLSADGTAFITGTSSGATFPTNFTITGGSTSNYITGTGTAASFNTSVLASVLTGFSASAGTVSSADTVLQAFNKIVGNQNNNATTYANINQTAINLSSSAGTLSMTTTTKNIRFTHTGTGSAWTESSAASFAEYKRTVTNKGSGNVVITAGTNQFLYNGVTSTTLTIIPNRSYTYYSDGTNWIITATTDDNDTGWAIYTDNVYTSGSPLTITQGSRTKITNNAATVINTQLPTGVTSWWDNVNNEITPSLNGDSYLVNVRFTAESSSTTGLADVEVEVSGLGVISGETISMRKGIGNSQRISIVFDLYTAATFIANGGEIYLNSIDGDTDVYNISYKITRVHKAK